MIETITFGAYKTTETKAKAEVAQLTVGNPDLAKALGVAMECRNLADSTTLGSSSENVNLELTAKMNIVTNSAKLKGGALNKALPQKTIDKIPDNVDFCKSGKDRTGYVQTKNTQLAIAEHLGIDPQSKLGQKNLMSQVAGNHTQEMAGIQGGTIGCHSVKTNPEFRLNKQDKAMSGVINQKSSSFNSSIKVKTNKKENAAIVTAFETSFATMKPEKAAKIDQPVVQQKTRERAKSVSVAPQSAMQEEVESVRKGLEVSGVKSRGRANSLPPKPKGKDTEMSR